MVQKQSIKTKRVKDLEPGDVVVIAGLLRIVAREENGQWRFYEFVEDHKRITQLTLGRNSNQLIQLVENSKNL